ncbi:MAG: histidinol dehydrogenase [Clostridia bacterium]
MIKIVDYKSTQLKLIINNLKNRSSNTSSEIDNSVKEIIENVKQNGDKALYEYSKKFDNVELKSLKIDKNELKNAYDNADDNFKSALEKAAVNIRKFHEKQKQQGFISPENNGVVLGQRIRGLHKVGIYVPGGTAAYPSSVLMNAIPAKIAQVGEIIMVTPPSKNGKVNPDILTAAYIAGVDSVYCVGGAQAVAALAFSTESIPKVDKIVGPGNIYVATAKKQLFGVVDIDMIAGPSEILIIADEKSNPAYIAADLMGQAEHDVLASAILVTTSKKLADKVNIELEKQLEKLNRNKIIKKSIEDFGLIIGCDNISQAVNFANDYAPEHLEVMLDNPFEYIGQLDNAGSVFLGEYSPEALGDYFAGPNHVLPTSSTARFFSPLGVDSFIKKSSFIYYTKAALEKSKNDIMLIAEKEGLTAHKNSIKVRFDD